MMSDESISDQQYEEAEMEAYFAALADEESGRATSEAERNAE